MDETQTLTRKANKQFGKPPKGWTWFFKLEGSNEDGEVYAAYHRCYRDGVIETDQVPAGWLYA